MRGASNQTKRPKSARGGMNALGAPAATGLLLRMEPREIADVYDRIARHWAEPSLLAANGIAAHAQALLFLGTRRGAALDVGCGANPRLRRWLLAQGFAVEGVDISQRMIELARRAQPELKFHQADICEWMPPQRYDFITAWDSI